MPSDDEYLATACIGNSKKELIVRVDSAYVNGDDDDGERHEAAVQAWSETLHTCSRPSAASTSTTAVEQTVILSFKAEPDDEEVFGRARVEAHAIVSEDGEGRYHIASDDLPTLLSRAGVWDVRHAGPDKQVVLLSTSGRQSKPHCFTFRLHGDAHCQVCGTADIETENGAMVYCDGCNRSYHDMCYLGRGSKNTQQKPSDAESWLCPVCEPQAHDTRRRQALLKLAANGCWVCNKSPAADACVLCHRLFCADCNKDERYHFQCGDAREGVCRSCVHLPTAAARLESMIAHPKRIGAPAPQVLQAALKRLSHDEAPPTPHGKRAAPIDLVDDSPSTLKRTAADADIGGAGPSPSKRERSATSRDRADAPQRQSKDAAGGGAAGGASTRLGNINGSVPARVTRSAAPSPLPPRRNQREKRTPQKRSADGMLGGAARGDSTPKRGRMLNFEGATPTAEKAVHAEAPRVLPSHGTSPSAAPAVRVGSPSHPELLPDSAELEAVGTQTPAAASPKGSVSPLPDDLPQREQRPPETPHAVGKDALGEPPETNSVEVLERPSEQQTGSRQGQQNEAHAANAPASRNQATGELRAEEQPKRSASGAVPSASPPSSAKAAAEEAQGKAPLGQGHEKPSEEGQMWVEQIDITAALRQPTSPPATRDVLADKDNPTNNSAGNPTTSQAAKSPLPPLRLPEPSQELRDAPKPSPDPQSPGRSTHHPAAAASQGKGALKRLVLRSADAGTPEGGLGRLDGIREDGRAAQDAEDGTRDDARRSSDGRATSTDGEASQQAVEGGGEVKRSLRERRTTSRAQTVDGTSPLHKCIMCQVMKPLKEFARSTKHTDDRAPHCRACDPNAHKAPLRTGKPGRPRLLRADGDSDREPSTLAEADEADEFAASTLLQLGAAGPSAAANRFSDNGLTHHLAAPAPHPAPPANRHGAGPSTLDRISPLSIAAMLAQRGSAPAPAMNAGRLPELMYAGGPAAPAFHQPPPHTSAPLVQNSLWLRQQHVPELPPSSVLHRRYLAPGIGLPHASHAPPQNAAAAHVGAASPVTPAGVPLPWQPERAPPRPRAGRSDAAAKALFVLEQMRAELVLMQQTQGASGEPLSAAVPADLQQFLTRAQEPPPNKHIFLEYMDRHCPDVTPASLLVDMAQAQAMQEQVADLRRLLDSLQDILASHLRNHDNVRTIIENYLAAKRMKLADLCR